MVGIIGSQHAMDSRRQSPTINRAFFGLTQQTKPLIYCQQLQEFLHALLLQDAWHLLTMQQTNVDKAIYNDRQTKHTALVDHLKSVLKMPIDEETRQAVQENLRCMQTSKGTSILKSDGRSVASYQWSFFPTTPKAIATLLLNKNLLNSNINSSHLPLIKGLMNSDNDEVKFIGKILNFSVTEQENDRISGFITKQRLNLSQKKIRSILSQFKDKACAQHLALAFDLFNEQEKLINLFVARSSQSKNGEIEIHENEEQQVTERLEQFTQHYEHNRAAIITLYAAIKKELSTQCQKNRNRQLYQTLKVPGTMINLPETLQFKDITEDGELIFDEQLRTSVQTKKVTDNNESWLPSSKAKPPKSSPKPARKKVASPHIQRQQKTKVQPIIEQENQLQRIATPPSDNEELIEKIDDMHLDELNWITPYNNDGEIIEECATHVTIHDPSNMLNVTLYSNDSTKRYQGSIKYKSNIREWFSDARKALIRQGYLDNNHKNFAQTESERLYAIQMHRFSKLVDTFIRTKGCPYNTKSRKNPNQSDICIVIPGQVEFLNIITPHGTARKNHCLFVYIIDSMTGYCYHRNMIPCSLIDLLNKWFASSLLIAEFPPLPSRPASN